jgi:hypothetical protein
MQKSANLRRTHRWDVTVATQHWEEKAMNYAKTRLKGYQPRTAFFSLCVGIIAIACAQPEASSITPFAPSVARDCADSANLAFGSPSPTRDEAFIDCIAARDPYAAPEELRHRLETGDGEGLFNRLMTGENLPIAQDFDCPYMRMAVQSPAGSDDAYQEPMRELFSAALMRVGFQVVDAGATHRWWASSLTLDMGEDSMAWTILVRAVPEIGGGAIQFTTIQKTVDGREGSFSGMHSLRTFSKDKAPEVARLAAGRIAKELLPAANRRCNDRDAAFEEAQMLLEQLRNELTEEIERARREKARREKASHQKQLKIEVEG